LAHGHALGPDPDAIERDHADDRITLVRRERADEVAGAEGIEGAAATPRLLAAEDHEPHGQRGGLLTQHPGELQRHRDPGGVVLGARGLGDRVEVGADDDVRRGGVEAGRVGDDVGRVPAGHLDAPRRAGRHRDALLAYVVSQGAQHVRNVSRRAAVVRAHRIAGAEGDDRLDLPVCRCAVECGDRLGR
jgi:hypothetical protein